MAGSTRTGRARDSRKQAQRERNQDSQTSCAPMAGPRRVANCHLPPMNDASLAGQTRVFVWGQWRSPSCHSWISTRYP